MDASLKALKEIFLFSEKKIKNKKKKKATIPNRSEREMKGVAFSTMILLVIKADDQSTTNISGIILGILFSLTYSSQMKLSSFFNCSF